MSEVLNHVSEATLADYDHLKEECGLFEPEDLALVILTGEDRKGWLQGQITNNLRGFDLGSAIAFCVCEPTGQILSVCDMWAVQDRFLISCARQTVAALLKRVEQMVVLEDVQAVDATANYTLLSIQGPCATQEITKLMNLPTLDAAETAVKDTKVYALRSNRTGMGGWDLWVPSDESSTLKKIRGAFRKLSLEVLEIARLEAGIPTFGIDIGPKTLPPELGAAFEAKHVSYNKGCYTGQEVLQRIHSRGHTNKTWMALVSEQAIESGAEISHRSRADAGTVARALYSPDYGHIASATLRNEAALEGESVVVKTSRGNVEAEVRRMPLLRLE